MDASLTSERVTPQVHQRGGSPQRPDGSTGRSLGWAPCSTGRGRGGGWPPDRRTPTASLGQSSRRQQQSTPLSSSALRARNALVLEHLSLADALASAAARRLFPLVEREDLIQVAREALVRSAPRCRAGEPPAPYLRRCITGALQHHLRDRVRLVRVPRRLHEQGHCPLRHLSLDASSDGEPCLLDQLAAPEAEQAVSEAMCGLALEQLVEQLPAAQATALRLTVLEGLSLRAAAERLEISAMSVQRAQKKAIAALRQQLSGGG